MLTNGYLPIEIIDWFPRNYFSRKSGKTKNMSTKIIAFRPSKDIAKRFEDSVGVLGVTDSELARRAYLKGYELACHEIAEERRKEAEKTLKLFGKGAKLPFDNDPHNLPLMAA